MMILFCPEMWSIYPSVWPSNWKDIVIYDGILEYTSPMFRQIQLGCDINGEESLAPPKASRSTL